MPALPGEPGHVGWRPLNWATEPVNGEVDIRQAVGWLATGLEGRDFRSDRLARDLGSGAEVVLGQVGGPGGRELAAVFTAVAGFVRAGNFRDYTVWSERSSTDRTPTRLRYVHAHSRKWGKQ